MNPQLELLLQIQDLKSQRHELAERSHASDLEEREFHIDAGDAVRQLDEKIEEIVGGLDPAHRKRLEKMSKGPGRAVVPLINGICYGCFTALPTSVFSEIRDQSRIRNCDNCGRFLYVVG
jgi:predicted  nucleic acid-binding Zn-ribbon protein